MTKIIIIFSILTLSLFGASETVDLPCSYIHNSYPFVDRIYYCHIGGKVTINSRNELATFSGDHEDGYDNDNVNGFFVQSNVYYFPSGLDIFKNLFYINVGDHLKDIRQVNLKPFNLLRTLVLQGTIEVLEEGLFDFNLELQYIDLKENKISHIDANVFNNLSKLSYFYIDRKACIHISVHNSLSEVQNVIAKVKEKCTNSGYLIIKQKIADLKLEADSLTPTVLEDKIKNLEDEVKKSKFCIYFEKKLEILKLFDIDD